MKKVTSVRIAGKVFPIDDGAYEDLQAYIEGLRAQLVGEEDADVKLEGIEKQIADRLDSKIKQGSASISELDVLELSKQNPRVQDYASSQPSAATLDNSPDCHRFYRDEKDKILGGVCSGIAHLLHIDPTIVRLIAAIFAFTGWGILIYFLLWIIVPAKELLPYSGRRVQRNSDHKVIAGVASGIANYFNIDATIVRVAFVAPILLNIAFGAINWPFLAFGFWVPGLVFGSLVGPFVVAYIVLWIVLPVAPAGSSKSPSCAPTSTLSRPSGAGSAVGFVIRFFFILIAGAIAFSLFVSLLALLFAGVSFWPLTSLLWTSHGQELAFLGMLFLFLGVPVVGFFIWLVRRIIGVKPGSHFLRWTFSALWALGWIAAIFFVASLFKDLRFYESSPPVDIPMTVQPAGKLLVTVIQAPLSSSEHYWWMDNDNIGWDFTENGLKLSFVKFNITKSQDGLYHASMRKFSGGRSRNDAKERAADIVYSATYANGVLDLGSGFAILNKNKYRGQFVEIDISVPAGRMIRFDDSITEKLNPVNIRIHQGKGLTRGFSINIEDNDAFPWDTDTDYVMNANGVLSHAN